MDMECAADGANGGGGGGFYVCPRLEFDGALHGSHPAQGVVSSGPGSSKLDQDYFSDASKPRDGLEPRLQLQYCTDLDGHAQLADDRRSAAAMAASAGGNDDANTLAMSVRSGSCVGAYRHTKRQPTLDDQRTRTSSQYRGVTRVTKTMNSYFEARIRDSSSNRNVRSVNLYVGSYRTEEEAARPDLASLKYKGTSAHTNFPIEDYEEELEEMKNMTKVEYATHLRRKSSGFSRGMSIYRGVTGKGSNRWESRTKATGSNYLGTFSTEEKAAQAYDIAAIRFKGASAITNFDITRYDVDIIIGADTILSMSKELAPNRRYVQEDEPSASKITDALVAMVLRPHNPGPQL